MGRGGLCLIPLTGFARPVYRDYNPPMADKTSSERIPDRLRSQFAALSRVSSIRTLLAIFALCGIAWGTLLTVVGSATGPIQLVAGVLYFLGGAWCAVLAVWVFRGGRAVYYCLLLSAVGILLGGAIAVAAAASAGLLITAVHSLICLPLPLYARVEARP